MTKIMHCMSDPVEDFRKGTVILDRVKVFVPRPALLEELAELVVSVRGALDVVDVEFSPEHAVFECYPWEGLPVRSFWDARYQADNHLQPKIAARLESCNVHDYRLEFWIN